jgi:Protein of unknown function (DUF1064)
MSKYNAKKTIIDGIQFDSQIEGQYYLYLKDKQEKGWIAGFTLQPRYLLEEGFEKAGKKYRPIYYVADFEILNNDGSIDVVDVKGFVTETAKMKFKLFNKKYHHKLSLVTYVRKYGGWVELGELKKLKSAEKR